LSSRFRDPTGEKRRGKEEEKKVEGEKGEKKSIVPRQPLMPDKLFPEKKGGKKKREKGRKRKKEEKKSRGKPFFSDSMFRFHGSRRERREEKKGKGGEKGERKT